MTSVIGTKVRRATSFVTNMEQIKHNKIRIIDIDLLLLHLFKIATASLSNIFSCSKALMATIRLNKLINTSKLIYSIFGECIKQLTIASISEMVSTKSFFKNFEFHKESFFTLNEYYFFHNTPPVIYVSRMKRKGNIHLIIDIQQISLGGLIEKTNVFCMIP